MFQPFRPLILRFLCIRRPWPGQARTIHGNHKRFLETYFSQYPPFYFTGDGCRRDEDGYYGSVDTSVGPQELWMNAVMMLQELNTAGLNKKAAEVLRNAGKNASVNNVGHIVVTP